MRKGSPGFVGSRLREAREAREMTALALSELIGTTAASVSAYEKGRNTPSPSVLDRIASVLDFKLAFFFRPEEDSGTALNRIVFERSRTTATKAARKRAQHRLDWLREILAYLGQFVQMQEVNVPIMPTSMKWLTLSDGDIEGIAEETRTHWNMGNGPISNMTLLAENNGVVAVRMPMGTVRLDAFSTWDTARPYIVIGDDGQSAFRTRFNVCHELGHLVLHQHMTQAEHESKRYFKMIEAQADRFASAFLTPAATFSGDITRPTLDAFRNLKPKWRTSVKMMIHRAGDLGVINREEARRLYIAYNQRSWHRGEPFDEEAIEEPRLVRRAFELLVDNDIIERPQVSAALPFNQEDIESLANLPPGYLDERDMSEMWEFISDLTADFPD